MPITSFTTTIFMGYNSVIYSGALNQTAAKYMASFPLTTMGNNQGQSESNPICSNTLSQPCEEDIMLSAMKQIRSYSSETRLLFYINSIINFPNYRLSLNFTGSNEKYLLHDDKTGKLVYMGQCSPNAPNYTIFDASYNETRQFWLDTVKYAMTKYPDIYVDGIFADRARATTKIDLHCVNFTDKHRNEWQNGHTVMLNQAMKMVFKYNTERGIIIGNGANITNGRMYENFTYNDKYGEPGGNDMITLMNESDIQISEVHKDKCTFFSYEYNSTLAAYLIGAVKYSYYMCTQGWTLQTGWDQVLNNPDFSKPLGKPIGNASIINNNGSVYYREFEKGVKVWLDNEWKCPCIKWNDQTITGKYSHCNRYFSIVR